MEYFFSFLTIDILKLYIDHNKRFNSKSSSQMGDNNSQVNGEKPFESSKNVNTLADRSLVKLSGYENKQSVPSDPTKSVNMVKLKFPSINNTTSTNKDFHVEKDNIFSSNSFVKSESAYKDTIKS